LPPGVAKTELEILLGFAALDGDESLPPQGY
jgi:hypothetical protein